MDREVTDFFEEVTHQLRLRDRKEWARSDPGEEEPTQRPWDPGGVMFI